MCARLLLIVTICLASFGCEQPPPAPAGISYAEAITIYNQELELLDRLRTEKAELEKQLNPIAGESLAETVLEQATALQGEYSEALEDLLPNRSQADDAEPSETDPLTKVRERVDQIRQERLEQAKPIQQRLDELAQEISDQADRVDQAKKVLDEARQRSGETAN